MMSDLQRVPEFYIDLEEKSRKRRSDINTEHNNIARRSTDKRRKLCKHEGTTEGSKLDLFQSTVEKRRTSLSDQVSIHPATRLAAVARRMDTLTPCRGAAVNEPLEPSWSSLASSAHESRDTININESLVYITSGHSPSQMRNRSSLRRRYHKTVIPKPKPHQSTLTPTGIQGPLSPRTVKTAIIQTLVSANTEITELPNSLTRSLQKEGVITKSPQSVNLLESKEVPVIARSPMVRALVSPVKLTPKVLRSGKISNPRTPAQTPRYYFRISPKTESPKVLRSGKKLTPRTSVRTPIYYPRISPKPETPKVLRSGKKLTPRRPVRIPKYRPRSSPKPGTPKILRAGKKLTPRIPVRISKYRPRNSPKPETPKSLRSGEKSASRAPTSSTSKLPKVVQPKINGQESPKGQNPQVLALNSRGTETSTVLSSGRRCIPRTSKLRTPKSRALYSSTTETPKSLESGMTFNQRSPQAKSPWFGTPKRSNSSKIERDTPNSNKTPQSFVCEICNEILTDKKSMLKHQRCHGTNKTNDTGSETPKKAALIRTPKSRNNLPAKFECDICQKKFRFGSNLKSHQAIHEQQRLFECSLCQNNLLVTALRSGHLVTKTTLLDRSESMEHKAVTSSDCCHGYHHPGDLKEQIQSKVRRFMCDKCARTFRSESNLSIHMKTHTIDKIKDILKATLSRFAAE